MHPARMKGARSASRAQSGRKIVSQLSVSTQRRSEAASVRRKIQQFRAERRTIKAACGEDVEMDPQTSGGFCCLFSSSQWRVDPDTSGAAGISV